jgi:serine/threonine protein kinase
MAFTLRDYQICGELGRGGFGTVYRAVQKSLGREVALKCLATQHAQNSDEIFRFRREAEAMASLTHDNIVTVFDFAYHAGAYYIVMEYIDGMSFETALEKGLPPAAGLIVLEKVAAALMCAHAGNITHRDIKPANILLGRRGRVKLADFGLAMFATGVERRTLAGSVVGTLGYCAPEALVSPREADNRVDIFAFGCILYQTLTGRPAFSGDSIGEISHRILNEEPLPIDSAAADSTLAGLTLRCLAKDREQRPAINEVGEIIHAAVQARYQQSQAALIAFVDGSGSAGPVDTPTLPNEGAPAAKRRERPHGWMPAGISVGAVVLVAAGFILLRVKPQPVDLPQIPGLSATAAVEAPRSSFSSGNTTSISADAPAPLTGSAIEMKNATVLFIGLSPGDTVLIDNERIAGRQTRIAVAPGIVHCVIRLHNGSTIKKTVTVAAYGSVVVDVADNRSSP